MKAVDKNPKSFQYIGKNLKDVDDRIKLAFQQNEAIKENKDLLDEEGYNKLNSCLQVRKSHLLIFSSCDIYFLCLTISDSIIGLGCLSWYLYVILP